MSIYAVVMLVDDEKSGVGGILRAVDSSLYEHYAPKFYLVRFGGTAQQLAEKVGFNEHGKNWGVVIKIDDYYGFADRDMWTWMRPNT